MIRENDKLGHLVALLSDGNIHSGESLGASLGMSRAAVWKQLQKLGSLGITVESVRGSGHRVPGGLDLLSLPLIDKALARQTPTGKPLVCVHQVVDSTNRIALERLQECGETGVFHLAEAQTAGRGRRGRTWVSPYGANIYLSASWVFEEGVAALIGLSLAAGVVLRRALLELTAASDVCLKWPNDLMIGNRKLGGILIELVGDPSDCCRVVLGVGINVRTPASIGESIDRPWVNLDEVTEMPISRNELAARLIASLAEMLRGYGPGAFARYREEWHTADAYAGRAVTLSTPSQAVSGIARGVDDSGALLLEREDGIEAYSGGEISLRSYAHDS